MRLNELHQLNENYKVKQTDADALYLLVSNLYEEHGFESMLDEQDMPRESKVIYTNKDILNESFDEKNCFIRPLSFYIDKGNVLSLIQCINSMGGIFMAEQGITDTDGFPQVLLQRPD